MQLNPHIKELVNKAVLITGTGRSGTTIVGTLVHSFDGVEYVFEPPLLNTLFSSLKTLTGDQFRLLYETYLYEDFLIDVLAGRRVNMNTADDSSIFHAKDEAEIQARQSRSWRKQELELVAADRTIVYKLPDVIHLVPTLQSYYPGTKVIVTARRANDVFHSTQKKGWFTDAALKDTNRIWPYTLVGDIKVPWFVAENDREYFAASDELHRIAYYYLANVPPTSVKNMHVVSYERLVNDAKTEGQRMADFLGRPFGPKTEVLLASVSPRTSPDKEDLVSALEAPVRKKVEEASAQAI